MAEYNPIIQYESKPTSKAAAIKAKCGECMGCTRDQVEPGWRDLVRNCTSFGCPLYNHRPFRGKANA
jgi:hypothetical protein